MGQVDGGELAETTCAAGPGSRATHGATLALLWVEPALVRSCVSLADHAQLSVGRDATCDVCLPVSGVSRQHAQLLRAGAFWTLEDRGSTNGTYCNGERITSVPLAPDQVIRMGDAVGVVVPDLAKGRWHFAALAEGLLGGERLARVLADAQRIARSELSMVVVGPSGTGKEQVARAVHAWSGRPGAFVGLNCAALPQHLVEGELFGYRRGAFTGAERAHPGLIRSADTGTLFLDEVLELSLDVQAKLLRVLETKEVLPLGETRASPVDVRVVAAAQAPLAERVAQGTFREDLQARLEEYAVSLPPLCERREDVPGLFRHLFREACGGDPPRIEARVMELLCLHDWPRNVRELRTVARRLAVLSGHEASIGPKHLPDSLRRGTARSPAAPVAVDAPGSPEPLDFRAARDHDELARLRAALVHCGGNVRRAAEAVNISRQRAYRLFAAYPELAPKRR